MKDFISKITFGFFMAQFVPGVIVVYSISLIFLTFGEYSHQNILCVSDAIFKPIDIWLDSTRQIIVFLALCTGGGMAIHGLHWAVVGFLETHYAKKEEGEIVDLQAIYDTFWHNKLFIIQVILGPVKIIGEICLLFFTAKSLHELAIEENVVNIGKDKMEAFNFLQEFYLHFAQFYAHTSYALVLLFFCGLITSLLSSVITITSNVVFALCVIWIISGFFFSISRIQFASLFRAEHELCGPDKTTEKAIGGSQKNVSV